MNFSAQPCAVQASPSPLIEVHKGAAEGRKSPESRVGNSAQRDLEPMEEQLVALLRRGWVSPQDALREVGCFSLSQRCGELRRERNLAIVSEWRQAGRSKYKVYRLLGGA